jgi:hypothetical protein
MWTALALAAVLAAVSHAALPIGNNFVMESIGLPGTFVRHCNFDLFVA